MNFCVLTADEYRAFLNGHPQASFMQTVELSELKKESGSKIHFVGVKENDKLVAGSMILEDSTILNQKQFYAPRGLLVDYSNKELLAFFTNELKKYIKKHGGFILTIDPNVLYRVRTTDGDLLPDDKPNDEAVNNLIDLGYKHYGFNIYLDALQVRWCCRFDLDEDYETKKAKFSKQTRKNINSCVKKGLLVKEGTIDDLQVMAEIFETTSKRRNFFYRSLEYYQKMYKHMKDLMTIYVAFLDPDVYYEHTKSLLDNAKKNYDSVLQKIEKLTAGDRLLNQKEEAERQIEKYEKELIKAEEFRKENPDGKAIGCLLSLRSGDEYLTLSSGVLMEYRQFTPKYLMYEHHIKEAYKEGFKYCNFYGITGDFNPENEYYGIYEFKKGFKPDVTEYIGQFELKITPFYDVYKLLKKVKGYIGK
ncbi:MAG: peptidoglycan bridge formation glycyltransferase FemA/FemB family protein [Clostridia bacterium]|nr:peptidoglycan bridge formation glycyltransferase FemA/FemB family protein [Clostridia bacterium]